MNHLMQLNTMAFPMSSLDLLEIINNARNTYGKKPMRHDNFMVKCQDELDGMCPEISGDIKMPNGGIRKETILMLSREDALCVAMRESKHIRKQVVEYIKYLEKSIMDYRVDTLKALICGMKRYNKEDESTIENIIKQEAELGLLLNRDEDKILKEISIRLLSTGIEFKSHHTRVAKEIQDERFAPMLKALQAKMIYEGCYSSF